MTNQQATKQAQSDRPASPSPAMAEDKARELKSRALKAATTVAVCLGMFGFLFGTLAVKVIGSLPSSIPHTSSPLISSLLPYVLAVVPGLVTARMTYILSIKASSAEPGSD